MLRSLNRGLSNSILRQAKMSTFPHPTSERQSELSQNYEHILSQVEEVSQRSTSPKVRLVAVSKLKPSSDIMGLYNIGVRHFGENYVQELIGKAKELPTDIKWHFIGGLQTGKCKDLAKEIPNLYAVETIDSLKKCKKIESSRRQYGGENINIYLQVNTSEEDQKSGFSLKDQSELKETVKFLLSEDNCTLTLQGLMTIGSFTESTRDGEGNMDFAKLLELKKQLDEEFGTNLELSMGMSNDFQQAIRQGSTTVRVGSSIFGARPVKK